MLVSITTAHDNARVVITTPISTSSGLKALISSCTVWTVFEAQAPRWTDTRTDTEFQMAISFTGPFAACAALRTAASISKELPEYAHRHPQVLQDREITFDLNGTSCSDFSTLERMAETLPDNTYSLGTFLLSSDRLRVSDPCYAVGTPSTVVLTALPGQWHAHTQIGPTSWNFRVKLLQVRHESLQIPPGAAPLLDTSALLDSDEYVEVDSGQCGFFDDSAYPRNETQLDLEPGTFYSGCCDATENRSQPGGSVVRLNPLNSREPCFGAVSSSGFGDGGYPLFVKRDKLGRVVLAQILFVSGLGV